ncbi:MAG: hypothetical protein CMB06_02205 [Euryarchaeota archaeon]|nr:hypothetical protein [Euryarchaeota archaeon]
MFKTKSIIYLIIFFPIFLLDIIFHKIYKKENSEISHQYMIRLFCFFGRKSNLIIKKILKENDLYQIETGKHSGAQVWGDFVESFRELHESAIAKKKEKPTKRQLDYYLRLADLVSNEELEKIIGNEDPREMDGKRIGEVIDDLRTATEDMPMPASVKQISYAKSLAESLEMDESTACKLVGLSNFNELTGGKSGTASDLIGNLKGKVDSTPRPPSPKQLNFIKNLAKKAELDEEVACKMVGISSYSELSGGRQGTASKLIETLRKKPKKK